MIAKGFKIGLLFVILANTCQADPEELFLRANELYGQEMYHDAITLYDSIISMGYESAGVYYNLGNAWFKLNDLPNAILNYERARKLAPGDEDILFNLHVAKTKTVDKIEPVPELFLYTWWRSLYTFFSSETWTIAGIVLFFLFFFCLAFYLLSRIMWIRKTAFYSGIVILILSVFSIFLGFERYKAEKSEDEAIVFTPTVTVKSSPRENSVDLFVIHEGAKVSIIDEFEGWYEIRIESGSIGWMPASSARII